MIQKFLRSLFKISNTITLCLREYRWITLGILLTFSIFSLPPSIEMVSASPLQTHNTVEIKYHTVGIGDTLIKIARRYGVSVGAIQNANGLDDADFIWQGQKLRIPVLTMPSPDDVCVRYHRVEAGQVLSRIALNYGVTVQALLDVNNLANADSVRSETALCIPSNRPATQAPTVAPTQVPTASYIQRATPLPTYTPPAPVEPAPVKPAPVGPAPVKPTAVESAPEEPVTEKSVAGKSPSSEPLITFSPSSADRLQPTGYLYIQFEEDDTVVTLAEKYDVDLEFLLYLNQIPDMKAVEVGQTVVIPTYDEEKVETAETTENAAETSAPQSDLYEIVKASYPVVDASTEEAVTPPAAPTAVATIAATAIPTLLPTKPVQFKATPTPVSILKLLGEFTVVGIEPESGLDLYGGEPNVADDIIGPISPAQQALNGYAPVIIINGIEWMFIGMETMGWVDSRYLAASKGQIEPAAAARANEVLFALRNQDMKQLAQFVHPEGVRFSPYSYLERRDLIFMPGEISELVEDDNVYRWGVYDGSGETIEMTWADYYQNFVWSADFAFPDMVGYDELVSHSNMIDNHKWIYPESVTIEYHFDGFDPNFGGLDWRSLRLVLEEVDGEWYVVAIINDQWTT